MAVRRITPNLACEDPVGMAAFYRYLFGLDIVMNMQFIVTMEPETDRRQPPQLSAMTEGGSGTDVPALSIEVDDLDRVIARMKLRGIEPEYGPVAEPWGVRRLYLRDPAGHLVNVLEHAPEPAR